MNFLYEWRMNYNKGRFSIWSVFSLFGSGCWLWLYMRISCFCLPRTKNPAIRFLFMKLMKFFQHVPLIFSPHFLYRLSYLVHPTMNFQNDLSENHFFWTIMVMSMGRKHKVFIKFKGDPHRNMQPRWEGGSCMGHKKQACAPLLNYTSVFLKLLYDTH